MYYLILVALFILSPYTEGGEVIEECTENDLNMQCSPEGDDNIIISEAWLYGKTAKAKNLDDYYEEESCSIRETMLQYRKGSVLQYINKKCGGQSNCTFSVNNVPGAAGNEDKWKGGVLRVVYHCKKKLDFYRACNSEIHEQTGWLQSVGYPEYYLGDEGPCSITISADEGQRIRLTVTDLSIRDRMEPQEDECRDYLSVAEGSKKLLQECGEMNKPLQIMSEGSSINVTLNAMTKLFPRRGYTAHFQAVGCQSPSMPRDGYRAYRNATHAEYWCCIHHVFPDTLSRQRVLKCNRGYSWNDTVPDCVDLEELLTIGNITETEYFTLANGTAGTAHAEMYRQAHFVYDLVVPTVIMSILVLGNVAVVLLIIYCRRGIMEENAHSEELESIKANPEPTDVLDTAPCSV